MNKCKVSKKYRKSEKKIALLAILHVHLIVHWSQVKYMWCILAEIKTSINTSLKFLAKINVGLDRA